MNNHKCFSFWLHDDEAAAFKKAQKIAKKKAKGKVTVSSIVAPAIRSFIKKNPEIRGSMPE